jgi:hypothetical protein
VVILSHWLLYPVIRFWTFAASSPLQLPSFSLVKIMDVSAAGDADIKQVLWHH